MRLSADLKTSILSFSVNYDLNRMLYNLSSQMRRIYVDEYMIRSMSLWLSTLSKEIERRSAGRAFLIQMQGTWRKRRLGGSLRFKIFIIISRYLLSVCIRLKLYDQMLMEILGCLKAVALVAKGETVIVTDA